MKRAILVFAALLATSAESAEHFASSMSQEFPVTTIELKLHREVFFDLPDEIPVINDAVTFQVIPETAPADQDIVVKFLTDAAGEPTLYVNAHSVGVYYVILSAAVCIVDEKEMKRDPKLYYVPEPEPISENPLEIQPLPEKPCASKPVLLAETLKIVVTSPIPIPPVPNPNPPVPTPPTPPNPNPEPEPEPDDPLADFRKAIQAEYDKLSDDEKYCEIEIVQGDGHTTTKKANLYVADVYSVAAKDKSSTENMLNSVKQGITQMPLSALECWSPFFSGIAQPLADLKIAKDDTEGLADAFTVIYEVVGEINEPHSSNSFAVRPATSSSGYNYSSSGSSYNRSSNSSSSTRRLGSFFRRR